MEREKLLQITMDIFREIYQNSTPKANFDELLKSEDKDFYKKYFIDREKEVEIVEKHLKKHKRLMKYEKELIKTTVYLGPSPSYNIKKET